MADKIADQPDSVAQSLAYCRKIHHPYPARWRTTLLDR